MEIFSDPTTYRQNRLGFHYYPDTVHYREYDLQKWLPRLTDLGASWLVLQSDVDRAIPESFIQGMANAHIEPIVQFDLSLSAAPEPGILEPLFAAYARWGVRAVQLFNRPNARVSWGSSAWAQQGLVERFLDLFIPYAEIILENGLMPVMPALEPGGSYWDTAFLRSCLESLERRGQPALVQSLALASYGWTGGHPLNWGAGGPERWPNARPYFSVPNEQDQRGFRAFDWYLAISEAVLGKACPLMIFQAGVDRDPSAGLPDGWNEETHNKANLAIARLLAGERVAEVDDAEKQVDPIPSSVVACNFWLLSASPHSIYANQAWYQEDEKTLPVVAAWKDWALDPHPEETDSQLKEMPMRKDFFEPQMQAPASDHPIKHYLLIPSYDWGVSDWHLEVIRPYVKKHHPTVGFSIEEAALAEQVTVVGPPQTFPESKLEELRRSGSFVERISGDGTSIATQLAER